MSLRSHLHRLVTVFIIALAVLSLVATGASWWARSQVDVVVRHAAPLQATATALQHAIDQIDLGLGRLGRARTSQQLSAIADRLDRDFAAYTEAATRRATLTGQPGETLADIQAAARELRRLSAERLTQQNELAARQTEVQALLHDIVAGAMTLADDLGKQRDRAQEQLNQALADNSLAQNRIKHLLEIKDRASQGQTLIAQIGLCDKRFKLNGFRDRIAALVDGAASTLDGDPGLSEQVLPALKRLQDGIVAEDTGLLALRAKVLSDPAAAEAKTSQMATSKQLTDISDELAALVATRVDELELNVAGAGRASAAALTRMASVVQSSAQATRLVSLSRAISSDLVNLATSDQPDGLARIREESTSDITALRDALQAVPATATATSQRQLVDRLLDAVTGEHGMSTLLAAQLTREAHASAQEAAASAHIATASGEIATTATAAAENQLHALEAVAWVSGGSLIAVLGVGLAALLIAVMSARRIGRTILGVEEAQRAQAQRLQELLGKVHLDVSALTGASGELTTASQGLARRSTTTDGRAGAVAAASRQIASEVAGVTSSAEAAGERLAMIATNAEQASSTAAEAGRAAAESRDLMHRLEAATTRIGESIKVISDIAETTNLLALNASIEAASAGEAGRGFAIVAGEVKGLSRQTAEASAAITTIVAEIQGEVQRTVAAITGIGSVIARIETGQSTIVTAVHSQTEEVRTMLSRLSGAARSCQEIAGAIAEVSSESSLTVQEAAGLDQLARRLAALATGLEALCKQPA